VNFSVAIIVKISYLSYPRTMMDKAFRKYFHSALLGIIFLRYHKLQGADFFDECNKAITHKKRGTVQDLQRREHI